MLRIYNTLTGNKQPFVPAEGDLVRIYTCGPTVYDYAHLGNWRSFVCQDILRRYLQLKGFRIKQVMNYTDVDDKTIRNSQEAGLSLREYTQKFIEAFDVDRGLLNIEEPEILARATDHIAEMAVMIQGLLEKGHAYRVGNSLYFRVSSFPSYGRLSRIDLSGIKAGARVDVDEYAKDDVRDFVLWKGGKPGDPRWDTPLGRGRPGWHIECSAMARKHLGENFDIHAGGTDLIFPHHENELAQSEALTGKPFARTWFHVEHLVVNGKKMSKSLGNFYTLRDLLQKGFWPTPIRFLLAKVPYRTHLNFTFAALRQASKEVDRLRDFHYRLKNEQFQPGSNPELTDSAQIARQQFAEAMDDDLNTARALAAIFDLVRDANTAMDAGRFRQANTQPFLETLESWDRIFAVLEDSDYDKLKNARWGEGKLPPGKSSLSDSVSGPGRTASRAYTLSEAEIAGRIKERERARKARDYAKADQIRNELDQAGIVLEDTKMGIRWKRK